MATNDPAVSAYLDAMSAQADQFLAALRQQESGGNYSVTNSIGASGAYQFMPGTWKSAATAAGFGQYADQPAGKAPPGVQDAVAKYQVTQYYEQSGGDWSNVAKSWYAGPGYAQDNQSAPQANGAPSIDQYAASVMANMNGGSGGSVSNSASPGAAASAADAATAATSAAATTNAANNQSAWASLQATLNTYGLGNMAGWAQGEMTAGKSSDQVLLDLQSTPEFQAAFPGMAIRQQRGLPAISVADYLSYADQAQQAARAAGLPQGFMSNDEIGQLVGSDVSASELSDRLNNVYAVAANAPQETKNLLAQYFGWPTAPGGQYQPAHNGPFLDVIGTVDANGQYNGYNVSGGAPVYAYVDGKWQQGFDMSKLPPGTQIATGGGNASQVGNYQGGISTGALAALLLDPTKAEPLLKQQLTAAQIGGAGIASGVGDIGSGMAMHLSQMGVSAAQAQSGFNQIGVLAPLEQQNLGQGPTVSADQLASSQFIGDAASQRAVQVAQEYRKSPFSGGGGYTSGAGGVTGAGYGSS